MEAVAVIGNPKPGSRTRKAAERLADGLGASCTTIELSELGAGLLGWGDPKVAAAVEQVKSADVLIAASPTFKATYTGLLKVFLDQFETGDGLAGQVAIPLMLGAAPGHAMAPDFTLRPILTELGATCPTAGLYQIDSTFETDESLTRWLDRWAGLVLACTKEIAR